MLFPRPILMLGYSAFCDDIVPFPLKFLESWSLVSQYMSANLLGRLDASKQATNRDSDRADKLRLINGAYRFLIAAMQNTNLNCAIARSLGKK